MSTTHEITPSGALPFDMRKASEDMERLRMIRETRSLSEAEWLQLRRAEYALQNTDTSKNRWSQSGETFSPPTKKFRVIQPK